MADETQVLTEQHADTLSELEARQMPPCAFVLFGATGDLAARKIAPALYNLANGGMLGPHVAVLGVARRARSDEQFRNEMLDAVRQHSRSQPVDMDVWNAMAPRWHYHVVEAESADEYRGLAARLAEIDARYGTEGSRLFYLAMPPGKFSTVISRMQQAGLNAPGGPKGFVRLVVEKPFGTDLATAERLNATLLEGFQEEQVFRIDHYLG
ncbi:MAG: glucose-6-phosphate dehydrogenase, partial [Phycisphaerae bacterium]